MRRVFAGLCKFQVVLDPTVSPSRLVRKLSQSCRCHKDFNFKQSTHAQKKSVFILFLSIIYIHFYFYFFVNKRHTHTHTRTHKELSWDVNNFSFSLWSSALLSVLVLIFLLLSFSVQFLFREVLLPHCRFKGYNAIKYLNT